MLIYRFSVYQRKTTVFVRKSEWYFKYLSQAIADFRNRWGWRALTFHVGGFFDTFHYVSYSSCFSINDKGCRCQETKEEMPFIVFYPSYTVWRYESEIPLPLQCNNTSSSPTLSLKPCCICVVQVRADCSALFVKPRPLTCLALCGCEGNMNKSLSKTIPPRACLVSYSVLNRYALTAVLQSVALSSSNT